MKIAVLCPRFPYPPDRGDRLTIFTLLRLFSEKHEVTLLSLVDGTEVPDAIEKVSAYARVETVRLSRARSWAQAWLGLFSAVPSQVSYYRSEAMRALVRRALAAQPFDVVFTHTFRMAQFAMGVAHPARVMWLGDSTAMALGASARVAPWWKRRGILWEARRVQRYQVLASRSHVESWALSAVDQQDLQRIGCHNVQLVPHGVDERLFDVEPAPTPDLDVVFLGNLSVPHNIDAAQLSAREIWPAVRTAFPSARLRLVGAHPTPAVRRLSTLEGVDVVGFVPDLREVWRSARVLLSPLRFGSGIQNKILEAMAAGVPVVTTPRAAEAIQASHGEHLLVSESVDGLSAAVIDTLRDRAAAEERARRARRHVRDHFTWTTILHRIERVAAAAKSSAGQAEGRVVA